MMSTVSSEGSEDSSIMNDGAPLLQMSAGVAHAQGPVGAHADDDADPHGDHGGDALARTGSRRKVLFMDFVNVFKSFIGTNVLGLPYAFRKGGIYAGVVLVLAIATITELCIRLLLRVRNHLDGPQTYGGIGKAVMGVWGKRVVNVALVFTQFGFCCGYMIFMSHNAHNLASHITITEWVLIFIPLMFVQTLPRDLRKIAPASMVSNVCLLIGVSLCVAEFAKHLRSGVQDPDPIRGPGLPIVFGIATSAFEGIGLVLPIERSMGKDRAKFPLLLDIVLVLVCGLLSLFGILGYLSFGADTESIITLNMPHSGLATTLKVMLVIAIVFTYPMQIFPVVTIAERQLKERFETLRTTTWWGVPLRLVIVSLTGGVALAIPHFGLLASLVGSVGSSLLAFILPTVLHRHVFRHTYAGKWPHVRDALLILFGVVGGVVGAVTTIKEMIE